VGVGELAEVAAVGGDGDGRGAGGARAIIAAQGVEARFAITDLISGCGIGGKVIHAAGIQFRVVGGVVERFVEHDVDVRGVGGGDEVGELGERGVAGVGLAEERVDWKKFFTAYGLPTV